MSTPAVTPGEPTQRRCLAPLPTTRRGYGIQLNVSKDNRIVYTNGRVVYLRSLADPADCLTFTEHKANVTVAVFSPSGYWVASGDDDGNVLIWSYPQMKVKNTVKIGKSVLDLDWDESSTRIVAVGDGAQNKAKVFSWDSGNNLGEISMHTQAILSVSYRKHRPFRIVTGSEDLSVNMYEGPPFKYSSSYKGHSRYPNGVKYAPNGETFVSVGADSKIVVYEGKTAEVVKEIESKENGHKGAIYAFAWSPDSKSILTSSADKTAKIWNLESGSVTHTFTFGNDVNDQQVGALWAGDYIVTVSLSGAINYLDINNPSTPKRIIQGHQTSIQSISLDRANGTFYTSALSGEIAQWDFNTGDAKWLRGVGHGGKVVSSVLVTGAGHLLSFGLDDKVRSTELKTCELPKDGVELGGMPVAAAQASNDSSLAAVVLAQEKVVLLRNGNVVSTTPLGFAPTAVCFNIDSTKLLISGKDKKMRIFTVEKDSVKQSNEITVHDKPVTSIRVSSNGELIASTDKEASIYLHTADNYTLKNKSGWRFHQAGVTDCDFSFDSTRLATASLDTNLIVWKDLNTFTSSERVRITNAHVGGADFVRFWDDQTLVSVGADRTIKVWNL